MEALLGNAIHRVLGQVLFLLEIRERDAGLIAGAVRSLCF
jgi:hypothetical protein